jgi:hypothetical protein
LEADCYPVTNWRGVSKDKPVRPVEKHPVDKAAIEVCDFPLGKATPKPLPAIDAQIDRHDSSDNFIKE